GAKQPPPRFSQGHAIEPTLQIAIVLGRMTQPLLERVVQPIERALAIERRRNERAIHLRERTVIQLLPSLGREVGHALRNAIGGLNRLVASPYSIGRRSGAAPTTTWLASPPVNSDSRFTTGRVVQRRTC